MPRFNTRKWKARCTRGKAPAMKNTTTWQFRTEDGERWKMIMQIVGNEQVD